MRRYTVYILANRYRSVFYVGMTGNLPRRLAEHRSGCGGFTGQYRVYDLIYVEAYGGVRDALRRERQLKGWTRRKKLDLVRTANPTLQDLTANLGPCL